MKEKLKSFKPLLLFMLLGSISYGQNIAPQSLNSGGTKATQTNGSLSFIIGELVVLSQSDSQGNPFSGGFTTCATLTTVNIQEAETTVLDVKVYPNPTMELVNIQINHCSIDQVEITIADIQGKEIYIGKYAGISNVIGINTATYAAGTYILTIKKRNNQVLGKYKIIKH